MPWPEADAGTSLYVRCHFAARGLPRVPRDVIGRTAIVSASPGGAAKSRPAPSANAEAPAKNSLREQIMRAYISSLPQENAGATVSPMRR